eukprot:CAMPEP_0197865568 /NCGR_PEP_ID=MMETSP1438-20131217/43742_1 /TAXON_ID=1461541 /ORGANISM="Pterosperma sp., Strain CCMP1384" /LENGTH=95 /DNA_ID=CAMNT_0043484057 /DNA_START=191 /DNA_END=478 /DNA_ORIENTATION=-
MLTRAASASEQPSSSPDSRAVASIPTLLSAMAGPVVLSLSLISLALTLSSGTSDWLTLSSGTSDWTPLRFILNLANASPGLSTGLVAVAVPRMAS